MIEGEPEFIAADKDAILDELLSEHGGYYADLISQGGKVYEIVWITDIDQRLEVKAIEMKVIK
jgi:hypothetical protein